MPHPFHSLARAVEERIIVRSLALWNPPDFESPPIFLNITIAACLLTKTAPAPVAHSLLPWHASAKCERAAAVFVTDPEAQCAPPSQFLKRMFGLTAAEARLSLLLLDGKTLSEATERVGITRATVSHVLIADELNNTAHSQLKAIFGKTGSGLAQLQLPRIVKKLIRVSQYVDQQGCLSALGLKGRIIMLAEHNHILLGLYENMLLLQTMTDNGFNNARLSQRRVQITNACECRDENCLTEGGHPTLLR